MSKVSKTTGLRIASAVVKSPRSYAAIPTGDFRRWGDRDSGLCSREHEESWN